MRSLSVLQKATRADVRVEPYPHIVVKGALPEDLCDELIASYPSPATMGVDTTRNNGRWDYSKHQVAGASLIPQLWRDFIAYHASAKFFHEIVDLFGNELHRLYPQCFQSRDQMKRLRVGVRGEDRFSRCDLLLDAQISGNTPVREASSVRTTHVDSRRALYGGLLYLRRDNDDSTGGDLTVNRFKSHHSDIANKLACFDGSYVHDKDTELVETVKYKRNVLVLFINSIDSLHGVTIRQPTPHDRIFVNLLGDMDEPLFELPVDIEKRTNARSSPLRAAIKRRLRKLSRSLSV